MSTLSPVPGHVKESPAKEPPSPIQRPLVPFVTVSPILDSDLQKPYEVAMLLPHCTDLCTEAQLDKYLLNKALQDPDVQQKFTAHWNTPQRHRGGSQSLRLREAVQGPTAVTDLKGWKGSALAILCLSPMMERSFLR